MSLDVKNSFTLTLGYVRGEFDGREIILPKTPIAPIADNSQDAYAKVIIVDVEKQRWAVALGTVYGTRHFYSCDIAALRIPPEKKSEDELVKVIGDGLVRNYHFKNSIVIATSDGVVAVAPSGPFAEFGRQVVYDWMPAGLIADVVGPQLYTEQFPVYLSKLVCEAIATNPP